MAFANSVSLQTDLNVSPYYDDYDETKNFHRVLFRPGYAVQGRELTQLQTILQNQIDRFGEHIFQEGSVVRGIEMNLDESINYVKVRDNDSSNASIDVTDFEGLTLTGQNSGVTAVVLDSLNGGEANYPNTKTLYVKYTNSGSDNQTRTFTSGEVILSGATSANVLTANVSVQIEDIANTGLRITFGEGIVYAKDHFIRADQQSLIIGRYSANVNVKVGYDIEESIVQSSTDDTLLDPAQGAYNYAAPGADRLKLYPRLVQQDINANSIPNFVELVRIKNGVPEQRRDKPVYSVINDYIARRTFDESGDYLVSGMNLRVREHLLNANNGGVYTVAQGGLANTLSIDVSSGKAYVRGYEIDNISTQHLPIQKGIATESLTEQNYALAYGNYVNVDNVTGNWDINEQLTFNLSDRAFNAVANTQFNTAPSSIDGAFNILGTAKVKAIEYSSGQGASAQYKLYLGDINMTANSFSNVKGIYFDDTAGTDIADIVLNGDSEAEIQSPTFNRAIWSLGADAIKTLTNQNYSFLKEYNVTIATNGTFTPTLDSGLAQEVYTTGAVGLLTQSQKRDKFYLVSDATANTDIISGFTATRSASSVTVTRASGSTNFDDVFNPGDAIQLAGDNVLTVNSVSTTSMTVSGKNVTGGGATAVGVVKWFYPGSVIDLGGKGGNGATDRTVNVTTTSSATFDIKETFASTVNAKVVAELTYGTDSAQQKSKFSRQSYYVSANCVQTTAGPWNLGLVDVYKLNAVRVHSSPFTKVYATAITEGTDYTSQFEINTGQTDTYYKQSQLKLKNNSTLSLTADDHILVELDFFEHDQTSGKGYFSVDSYPIDDVDLANTDAVSTAEIPIFTSPTSGTKYQLRDSIDFRPSYYNSANLVNSANFAELTVNPNANTTTSLDGSSLIFFPSPNENFESDLEYYLPRVDRIVVTSSGEYRAVKGVSRLKPITPESPPDGLTIGYVHVSPYPSLPQEVAETFSRPDLGVIPTPVRQVRYTMRDIGVLKKRLDNLEYYTSLSLLENDTKNMVISDSNGNARFKNGILVEPFTGHNIGDVQDSDYHIAIDPRRQEMRPEFKLDDVQFEWASGGEQNGKYITLPILAHDAIVDQPYASSTRNATALAYNYVGEVFLDPSTDYWTDSVRRPNINVNFDFNSENWSNLANFLGSQWESWETTTSSTRRFAETREIQTGNMVQAALALRNGEQPQTQAVRVRTGATIVETTSQQQRTGSSLSVSSTETTQSLGDSVRDVSIIPFMRSREIQVTGRGLKPSTRVYAFFDGEDVNDYMTPTNSSFANTASEGGAVTTDSSGNCFAIFRLPNDDRLRFNIGQKTFRLTDSLSNATGSGAVSTWAEDEYSASGLSTEVSETIISTRQPVVSVNEITQTRTVTDTTRIPPPPPPPAPPPRRGDPTAQSFIIDTHSDSTGSTNATGVFMTRLDLFFAAKDSTEGVFIEIREVDPSSGFISNKVIPFSSQYLTPAQVNTSDDATVATTVTFSTPIYLLTGVEYAWVVKPAGGNPNYTLWVARMGETDLITGNRIISNPYSGTLFISANDRTWTAVQEEDAKFVVYIADFGTNQSATAVFNNIAKEYLTLEESTITGPLNIVGEPVHGETTITTAAALTGAAVGDSIVSDGANGTITTISGSTYTLKDVTLLEKFENTDPVYLYQSGANTGTTSTINSTPTTPTGKVYFYDSVTQADRVDLHLDSPTGTFAANTTSADGWIRGQVSGFDAQVTTLNYMSVDAFSATSSRIDIQGTSTTITSKLNTSTASLSLETGNQIDFNETVEMEARRYLLSESLAGNTGEISVLLENANNNRVSPVVDTDRIALFAVENLINNVSTNETGTAGGDATARYITQTVTLADGQDAEDLKVYLTGYKPTGSSINVYFKALHREDSDTIADRSWVEMTQVTDQAASGSSDDNRYDFKEFEFTVPTAELTGPLNEIQYVNSENITFTGFKYYKIKVVLTTPNTYNPPRVKDLRAIALQV